MADHARGEKLRRLRESRHLSQEDAAHEIGVSAKTLRAWEKGGPIRWENAKAVAAFYEVEAVELVTREIPDFPPDDFSEKQASGQLSTLRGEISELGDQIAALEATLLAELAQIRSVQEDSQPSRETGKRKREAGGK